MQDSRKRSRAFTPGLRAGSRLPVTITTITVIAARRPWLGTLMAAQIITVAKIAAAMPRG